MPRRTRAAQGAAGLRLRIEYRDIHTLLDYENNPRDNSAAVASVANSIRSFGFLVPVVVDDDSIIIAGHTRVAAAKALNMDEVPVIQASHLSDDQIRAFRLVDNKVSELSHWDNDLLASELELLSSSGLLMTDFGWSQEELSCFGSMVSGDCLSTTSLVDDATRARLGTLQKRAPSTSRFVLGEITFFIKASDYRSWVDALRARNDYNESGVIAEVKALLGIREVDVEASVRVRRVRPPHNQ